MTTETISLIALFRYRSFLLKVLKFLIRGASTKISLEEPNEDRNLFK